MHKYTAVAIVAVSIVIGAIVALRYNRGEVALGLISLGGTLAFALGAGPKVRPPEKGD